MDKNKIQALITLLDDPNEEIFSTVEGELLKEEVDIIPDLEKAWEMTFDSTHQKRLENLIHNIQFKNVKSGFRNWLANSEDDLLYGAFLVSKYQYPELTYESINDKINQLRKDVWLELNDHLTALEKVRIINHILFDVHGYTRNNSNFMAPQNSFICDVLDTRKGNPISLSVIYSVIALRLGIPVYGVNLPKNFILAYLDDAADLNNVAQDTEMSVLFYINPINKGAVLGRKEIEFFVKQQKLEPKVNYFLPCSNKDIVQRMLNNIYYAYETAGHKEKANEMQELLSLFGDISG
ncbi:transglutaminase-like domain-containing protein [Natronoflexus pectinivorans]|uniref:Regulator of sirC expression with transglutaminase-like and TPR domain n=1 Tax=Natronoflexus pectinivorans TaxID=682526 RepID=A0A4R2GJZ5_9BACT|nr:transglutaminase-like domain-containing protein [Natronoflexus pectinivorans]TCO08897.1 regulator of sirC expression with transglutaminase-like and TPR domain [Natronoflexus pectinivorans]